jgi:hypothetical protein
MAEIGFLFQFGTIREIVTTNSGTLTLGKLKDMACEFINTKVSESSNRAGSLSGVESYVLSYDRNCLARSQIEKPEGRSRPGL